MGRDDAVDGRGSDYLDEIWRPAIAATVRASTLSRYRLDVRTLRDGLGSVRLQALTGAQLDAVYAKRLAKGVSAASVRHLHAVARRSLRDAVRNGLVARNAADAASPPHVARPELRTWTAQELRRFLGSLDDDRMRAAWWLLASTGMRRGELLALRWSNVDLEHGRVRIERSLVSSTLR